MTTKSRHFLALVLVLLTLMTSSDSQALTRMNCSGNPPRQAEDPLSAPCVASWNDANGGATWSGVTSTQIDVAVYNDLGVSGVIGSGDETGDPALVRTLAAQASYFEEKFMTYDRVVRLDAIPSAHGLKSTDSERRRDAGAMLSVRSPFATLYIGAGDPSGYIDVMTDAGVEVLGLVRHMSTAFVDSRAPFAWNFLPAIETEISYSASFICRSLAGGSARFSDDPAMRALPRRFALLAPSEQGSSLAREGALLQTEVKDQCDTDLSVVVFTPGASRSAARRKMKELQADRTTTVVCYCGADDAALMRTASSKAKYWPEWYFDDASGVFQFEPARVSASPLSPLPTSSLSDLVPLFREQSAFGVSLRWRAGRVDQQYAFKAFASEEPSEQPDPTWNPVVYYTFLELFNGIQGSGPQLDPQTFERSMFTFAYLGSDNPFEPTGGFGPYGLDGSSAVANHNFIDTAAAWWWDAKGTPPGGKPDDGCVRLMNQGRRYYSGEWSHGDQNLFDQSSPCTGDVLPG